MMIDIRPLVIVHILANSHPLLENIFHLLNYTIENHSVDTSFCNQGSSWSQNPKFLLGKSNVIQAFSQINYKNIEFHNDQICTVKVNPCNLMPKKCGHDKLILLRKSHWYMFLDKNLILIELSGLIAPPRY